MPAFLSAYKFRMPYCCHGKDMTSFQPIYYSVNRLRFFHIKTPATKRHRRLSHIKLSLISDCSCHLAWTEAAGAYINSLGWAVNNSLNFDYIRLPSSVGASVWVRNLDSKGYSLIANFTFCHFQHLLRQYAGPLMLHFSTSFTDRCQSI